MLWESEWILVTWRGEEAGDHQNRGLGRRPRRRITATGENLQKRPKIFGENEEIEFWTKQEFQIYGHASVN